MIRDETRRGVPYESPLSFCVDKKRPRGDVGRTCPCWQPGLLPGSGTAGGKGYGAATGFWPSKRTLPLKILAPLAAQCALSSRSPPEPSPRPPLGLWASTGNLVVSQAPALLGPQREAFCSLAPPAPHAPHLIQPASPGGFIRSFTDSSSRSPGVSLLGKPPCATRWELSPSRRAPGLLPRRTGRLRRTGATSAGPHCAQGLAWPCRSAGC